MINQLEEVLEFSFISQNVDSLNTTVNCEFNGVYLLVHLRYSSKLADVTTWRSTVDSCQGGVIDNIKLGLYKYFRFSKTKNQNTLISLVFNKNRCHK